VTHDESIERAAAAPRADDTLPEAPADVPAAPAAPAIPGPPADRDAPPSPDALRPPAAPPPVALKKDPERRSRRGLGAGAALIVGAALAPALLVAALLWPRAVPASPDPGQPRAGAAPAVDLSALRAAIEVLAADKRAPAAPAAAPARAASAAPLAFERPRVEAARALLKKIARARDLRREAGASLPELRKPFTIEELGGAAALKDLGVDGKRRLLVARDGRLVAPTGAKLPELADGAPLASKERDEDVFEGPGALDGAAVRVLRRCVAGELLCLLDLEPADSPAFAAVAPAGAPAPAPAPAPALAEGAPAPGAAASSSDAPASAAAAALLQLAEVERKLVAGPASPAGPAGPSGGAATIVPPLAGGLLGVLLALALSLPLALRLARTGVSISRAASRLRAAGRPAPAAVAPLPAELADLERAIDEALAALGDAAARASREERRRARAAALAQAIDEARGRFPASAELSPLHAAALEDDDASFAEVAAAARRLLESFERRVVRWKSHLEVVAAPPAVSQVEERAQAVAPLPGLLGEAAVRILRVARLPEVPERAVAELTTLGEALAARGRTAQTLIDQLLLDAVTDRPGQRPAQALDELRAELAALAPAPSPPTVLAALGDLPPAEVARRLAEGGMPPGT
jgi:hypothetical protein